MEPPMSNGSMRHQNPDLDFDDTGHFLQGALCTIAAHLVPAATARHHLGGGPGEEAVQGLRPGRRIVGLGVTDWGAVE
jgi:hypothetical protein